MDRVRDAKRDVTDNRALGVKCFNPEYTFVDKLQTICRRFRQPRDRNDPQKDRPRHFLRLGWGAMGLWLGLVAGLAVIAVLLWFEWARRASNLLARVPEAFPRDLDRLGASDPCLVSVHPAR